MSGDAGRISSRRSKVDASERSVESEELASSSWLRATEPLDLELTCDLVSLGSLSSVSEGIDVTRGGGLLTESESDILSEGAAHSGRREYFLARTSRCPLGGKIGRNYHRPRERTHILRFLVDTPGYLQTPARYIVVSMN